MIKAAAIRARVGSSLVSARRPAHRAARSGIPHRAIKPESTAVVLIEYQVSALRRSRPALPSPPDPVAIPALTPPLQNEFTTEGGKLHDGVKGVMEETGMLEKTQKVVSQARDAGCKIVHAPITFSDDYNELKGEFGILKAVKDGGCFKASEWGGAICDELKPADGDIVVAGKRGLDGFASTNLDFILRQNGIDTVVLGGFLTNCCVESTMRTAYEKGFDVVTLTDCTAALSPEEQAASVEKTYPMFSRPMTAEKFISEELPANVKA